MPASACRRAQVHTYGIDSVSQFEQQFVMNPELNHKACVYL